jgi:sphingomyelin phosphodiesterase
VFEEISGIFFLSAKMIFQCFYSSIFLLLALQYSHALPIVRTIPHSNELTSCELCNFLLPVAKDFIASNESSLIEELGIILCQHLHLADDAVCAGMIDEYNSVLIEVLRYSPLSTHEICGVAFNCMRQVDIPALKWNVTIPPPTKQMSSDYSPSLNTLSVLHLADLHIDTEYKPGSNANCGRPLCCRDGTPKTGEIGAGFWGDYRTCDLPLWTAENMLKYIIQNEEQLDLIYFTGDIAPHDVWQQTQTKDLEEISSTTRLLKQTFPTKKIYPCVGNHEAAPPDLFSTDDMSWLYLNLAHQWIDQFGLDEQTRETIIQGGYYTTIIAPKIRLISLNMNYCTENNYWLFINSTDPLGQLQWLIQWLQYAEEHQEKVHIIGHHPPRMCMVSFSWAYYSIVNRYQNTITAQFFAHTHNDEFMIFYNETDSKQPVSFNKYSYRIISFL